MRMKLEALIRKLHPDIDYRIFLKLHELEFMPAREITKGELKRYLDHEVVFIESDFTITIRSFERLF